jgi:predicted HicB family RNase H-like nuclease
MPSMRYKGYQGVVTYEKPQFFHGEVFGLKDMITFQGTSLVELKKTFKSTPFVLRIITEFLLHNFKSRMLSIRIN